MRHCGSIRAVDSDLGAWYERCGLQGSLGRVGLVFHP